MHISTLILHLVKTMTTCSLRKSTICLLLLIFSFAAQSAVTLSDPIPINPLLKVGKLDNGLTYYIQQNSKPEKRVELRLVVKAGSILEDDDQQGLAHFTEHMAFNGSRHFKKHELISYLQSMGIKFGADLNAYTSFNETVYILPIPTDKKENVETGFLVLEDWAHNLTMNDADIDAERNIILEEARLGKGASDRMNRKLYPALFNGSKYADRLPIGREDIIRHFKYDTLKRFYADWYRPDLMAVVVIGDIDPNQAERLVKAHFAHPTNPLNERPRNYPAIPVRPKSMGLVITDKEAVNNMLMIQFPVQPDVPEITIADYRKTLIKNLSTAILNERINELTQQAEPPLLGGGSSFSPLVHGYKSFSSAALIGRAGVESAANALIWENKRARQFGFNADELARAKKDQLRMFESAYNERNKSESAQYADEYIRHFLTAELIPGIVNEYTYVSALLPGITLEEVNNYAQNNIPDGTKKLVAYLGSNQESETIPTSSQLLTWANIAENSTVATNSDKVTPTTLMAHPPKAGSIVTETKMKQLGMTKLTLSNGLDVVLKPTNFKNDQILLSAARFGGHSLFDDADIYNARYASAIVSSMGLANYTPLELQKIVAGKSILFQTSSSSLVESLTGFAASADVESLFQFIHLRLAKPRTDSTLYAAFISRMQDISKNTLNQPETEYANAVLTTLYNHNPRLALAPTPTDFTHITMDRAAAIYNDRFSNAKGFTLILVGNFNIEKIKPLIATYLASLPTTPITSAYRDLNIRPVKGVVKKEIYRESEDKSEVTLVFTGAAQYSKEENMRFKALIEVMNLRIIDVLREKLSLIYSGGLNGAIDRIPYQNYRLNVRLPCSPENVDAVISATFSEIQKMKNDGPTQEELDKVKLNWIKNNNIALRTNEHWLTNLQSAILFNTDPADILTLEKRINAVTLTDVKEAAKRYFKADNYVQVVLYPKQK